MSNVIASYDSMLAEELRQAREQIAVLEAENTRLSYYYAILDHLQKQSGQGGNIPKPMVHS